MESHLHKKEFESLVPVLFGMGFEPLTNPAVLQEVGLPQALKASRARVTIWA